MPAIGWPVRRGSRHGHATIVAAIIPSADYVIAARLLTAKLGARLRLLPQKINNAVVVGGACIHPPDYGAARLGKVRRPRLGVVGRCPVEEARWSNPADGRPNLFRGCLCQFIRAVSALIVGKGRIY